MMQRLSNEMRGGQRSLKSTGSRSFELWFRRDRAAFRPVRSRLPVGIAPNNLSFHLDRLRHADLITVVRKGRWKIYSAQGEIMKNLLNYLTSKKGTGRDQRCRDVGRRSTATLVGG